MTEFTAKQKLACVARELAMRRRAYPRFVENGRMDASEAQREIAVMEAIVQDYQAAVRTPDLFSSQRTEGQAK